MDPVRPLAGRRVLVPASRPGPSPLAALLETRGTQVTIFPSVQARPGDVRAIEREVAALDGYRWVVFSGGPAAAAFRDRLLQSRAGWPAGVPVIAIGSSTVRELRPLRDRGLDRLVAPARHTAPHVLDAMGDVEGKPILLAHADLGADDLPRLLAVRGAHVVVVAAYRAELDVVAANELAAVIGAGELAAVALANPAAARVLAAALERTGLRLPVPPPPVACAGPATRAEADRLGLGPGPTVASGRLKDLADLLTGGW